MKYVLATFLILFFAFPAEAQKKSQKKKPDYEKYLIPKKLDYADALVTARPKILINGVELQIGMSKIEAIDLLMSAYNVKKVKNAPTDQYAIEMPAKTSSEPYYMGFIAFKDDKLCWVSVERKTIHGQEAAELADALYLILTSLNAQGENIASTKTTITRYENMTIQILNFIFTTRKVTIIISDHGKDGKQVQVTEVVQAK